MAMIQAPFSLVVYTHVGALSVMIWDMLHHMRDDYHLSYTDFCTKTFLYFLSKITTFLYVLMKAMYLTLPMTRMCRVLGMAISALFVIGVSSTLLLSTLHLCILLDRQKIVLISLLSLWLFSLGGSIILGIGISGTNPSKNSPDHCQDVLGGEWVGAGFSALFVFHAILCSIIWIGSTRSLQVDRDSLGPRERFNRSRIGHRRSMVLSFSQPLTMNDRIYYILTAALSALVTIWFFSFPPGQVSNQILPVTVYLVCASITIGRILRETKFTEQQRRKEDTMAPQIKLDIPRLDINDTISSTTRIIELSTNERRGVAQCDVAGLFVAEPRDCMLTISPAVEIEIKKVVESAHDSTPAESVCHDDNNQW